MSYAIATPDHQCARRRVNCQLFYHLSMSEKTHETDIAIIGAGPVGIFTVFEAGMLGLKCHVIDALDFIGGQCVALYPEKPIYDIPGYPEIEAQTLIQNLEKQASPFSPTYHLGQQVTEVTKEGDFWQLTTSKDTIIRAKAIIIAAGCGAFGPNRPPLEGIEAYEGTSVFYMVRRKEDFRDKSVVIAGGGDSAVDWALSLAPVAKKLYVIHRREKFRCAPESHRQMLTLADEGKIEMVIPYQLAGLEGNDGQLTHVNVQDFDGNQKALEADTLLPFFGLAMELGPIASWGLEIDKKHIAVDPTTLATNTPGIFAIGDIATYSNKLKLILNGFAEGALACRAAYHIIHPDKALHFEYSTTQGVPGQ